MTCVQAYYGVKKVLVAQVLSIIASIVGIAVEVIESNSGKADVKAMEMLGTLGAILLVLALVSYIINLVGLRQAGRDEPFFKKAFTFAILGLLCSVAGGALNAAGYETAQSITEFAVKIIQILITIYVIYGIISLAERLGDEKLMQRGKRLLLLITVMLFISIVIILMGDIMSERAGQLVLGAIGIVSAIIIFAAYVIYLLLLSRAVKTLGSK